MNKGPQIQNNKSPQIQNNPGKNQESSTLKEKNP